jgi:hypothetical protein
MPIPALAISAALPLVQGLFGPDNTVRPEGSSIRNSTKPNSLTPEELARKSANIPAGSWTEAFTKAKEAAAAQSAPSGFTSVHTEAPSVGPMHDYSSDIASIMNGGTTDFREYATPNQSVLKAYSQLSPEEIQNRQNVSDIARLLGAQGSDLYNVASPLYRQAANYYGGILSGNKAAIAQTIAPEAEALAEMNAAEQKSIENSSLRGGARDMALAESGRSGAGRISALVPQARKDAAAAASGIGLQGMGLGTQQEGAAASTYGTLAGMGQQDRQFAINAEMQNRFAAAGLDIQSKQLQLNAMLGMRGLDLQQMGMELNSRLQSRGLDLQEMLGMNSLNLQRELGLAGIKLSTQQVDLLKQQMQNEASAARGSSWASAGNLLITGLGMILPGGKSSGGGTSQLPINPLGAGLSVLAGR